ncbi:metal-dependent hydrolase [Chitinophaga sp. S165]|uniref:metal-dependent hydrolase n=1 Tax=Chitinophaga sp. S165 TaxID=2135462 RepID=UPI000D7173D0|nr:metal-dependent hydrolase [Chitinophaga sp. S165]PWV56316.1 L-ascorbate metabolism protein UlaG (beta-lactamase superfamily) [Chitinophaga sp. S165]
MELTYYGHSTFSVVAGGKHILFDPFISGNDLAKHIRIDEIKADYIFVSHGHFDHITDVASIAKRTGATVLGIWELYDHFTKQGVQNAIPLNPGGKITLDFGTAKSVPAQHSSSFPDGSYAGVAAGFVLTTPEGNFYYSGDTALTMDMSFIPKWTKLDFAVFPIGDQLTMGPEEAIEAAKLVEVNTVFGVHYDTFDIIRIDKANTIQTFKKAGVTLHLAGIGDTITI